MSAIGNHLAVIVAAQARASPMLGPDGEHTGTSGRRRSSCGAMSKDEDTARLSRLDQELWRCSERLIAALELRFKRGQSGRDVSELDRIVAVMESQLLQLRSQRDWLLRKSRSPRRTGV